jgi:hypothetical protein
MPRVTESLTQVERELAAMLAGRQLRPAVPAAFVDHALHHQVAPLLMRAGADRLLPAAAAERLRDDTRRHAILAALRDRELARVLDGLHRAGIGSLVVKGAHLAHACYPCSYLRVRADTDLLIRRSDVDGAAAALQALGYRRRPLVTGDGVLGQMLFDRGDLPGSAIDLHWRLSAPRLAAALLETDALFDRAMPIPALGAHALGPATGDALAIACVHQVAHHLGDDRLLWMYDVHLLLQALDDLEADLFVHRAAERGMARIGRHVIECAAARFPSRRAAELSEKLAAAAAAEPAAVLLEARAPLAGLLDDLSVERRWRERVRLVAGHLFPPPAYMRATWAPGSRAPLPVLYWRRLWRAAPRWLRFRSGSAAGGAPRAD